MGCREKVVATRMKRHRVDRLRVACVVLDEFVGADVPNFDCRVCRAGRDERAARMERHTVDISRILAKRVDALFRIAIPQLDCLVVRGANY